MTSYWSPVQVLYSYPEQTRVGSIIPKSKIYQHGRVRKRIREMFISQVAEMRWAYKLSPETLHLSESHGVREIQVFQIQLKKAAEWPEVLLETIDRAIPSPILFEVEYGQQIQGAATYKRPSRSDQEAHVIHSYLHTEWMDRNQKRLPLPTALSMGELYAKLLRGFSGLPWRSNEDLETHLERAEAIRKKESELARLRHSLEKEIQFNRKVDLNHRMKDLEAEIGSLVRTD